MEAIYHEEGRSVLKDNNVDFFYEYNLTDHLGNVRVTFRDEDEYGQVTEDEILQQNHYYPFGMQMRIPNSSVRETRNDYTYNGKEYNNDFGTSTSPGLDWLDYGARWYDPALSRFMQVDPLAEATPQMNTYHYVKNNPINRIDPTGMIDQSATGGSTVKDAAAVNRAKAAAGPETDQQKFERAKRVARKGKTETRTSIDIFGTVSRTESRSIKIRQVTTLEQYTTYEDGSANYVRLDYSLDATIATFDGKNNLVSGNLKESEFNCCYLENGDSSPENTYVDFSTMRSISTQNYQEVGIAGAGTIDNIMTSLNEEGWDDILITDASTKKIIDKFDRAARVLGGQGIYDIRSGVASAIISDISSAMKKSSQSTGASFEFSRKIVYKLDGED